MARLIHPTAGTVVTLEGNLEDRYRAAGWAEESVEQEQAPSEKPAEKPAPRARRARKN